MGIFSKFKKGTNDELHSSEDSPYIGLRQQILDLKPEQIGLQLENNQQVYAAVTDMPVGDKTATLVCVFDGTVSLYYSNGGGLMGMGQKYEEVKKAGRSFLFSAGQILPSLKITHSFDLPHDKDARVYLLTKDAIYQAKFNMSNISAYERPIQFLNFLIQNTLNKIRENS